MKQHSDPTWSAAEKQQFELLIAQFERAWHSDESPRITDFLPPEGQMRDKVIREMISIDREFRQQRNLPHAEQTYCELATTPPSEFGQANAGPNVGANVGSGGAPGRFRVLRFHAAGGLGRISVARDTELNRDVALKEIKSEFADNDIARSRFVLEAEITGGLEHPSIVPVYGLGTYADGRPFYAMRFIKGNTLKDAIENYHVARSIGANDGESSLELRQLLGRFIDVCQAVEYAHHRGVLHRDLKPGNIMLGNYGETLVVDWGLAKACGTQLDAAAALDAEVPLHPSSGSSVEPTTMGQRIGTLQYMSPEQASGKLDQLGPATDIFSLGATLYQLLSGKTVYHACSPETLIASVESGNFSPPSAVLASIPKPLEAICLKALAAQPAERYPTAQALLLDVERFLADEPVSAYQEPWLVRARRWARAHPSLVSGFSATALVTLLALLLGTILLAHKNSELATANLAETKQRQRAEREEAAAKVSEKKAREQTALAKANEAKALEQEQIATAVKDFLLYDLLELAKPASQAEANLEIDPELKVQELFRRADPKVVKLPLAAADQLQTILNQPVDPKLKIRDLLNRASKKIEGRFPGQPQVEIAMRFSIGNSLWAIGDSFSAIAHHVRGVELCQRELGPNDDNTLTGMNNLAAARLAAGQHQEAIELLEDTLQRRSAKFGPTHRDTLSCQSNLASAYRMAQRNSDAASLQERTLAQRTATFGADDPDTIASLGNLAIIYGVTGRKEDSIALFEQVVELKKTTLGTDHPDTLISRGNLAHAYFTAERNAEALSQFEEVVRLQTARLGPEHPHTLTSMNNLARSYTVAERYQEAAALCEKTLGLRKERLGAEHEDTYTSQRTLADIYRNSARLPEAIALYEEFLQSNEVLPIAHPDTLTAMTDLARCYVGTGRMEEGLALHQQTVERCQAELGADHSRTLRARHFSANDYLKAGRPRDAITLHRENWQKRKKLLGSEHADTLSSLINLANAYIATDKMKEALPLFEELAKAFLVKFGPDDPNTLHAQDNLAVAYRSHGRFQEALSLLDEVRHRREAKLGPDHPETLDTAHRVAGLYREAGRPAEGVPLFEDLLRRYLQSRGPNHQETMSAQWGLAHAHKDLRNWTAAEKHYLAAIAANENLPAAERAEFRPDLYQQLVALYAAWDKPDQAAKWQAQLEALKRDP